MTTTTSCTYCRSDDHRFIDCTKGIDKEYKNFCKLKQLAYLVRERKLIMSSQEMNDDQLKHYFFTWFTDYLFQFPYYDLKMMVYSFVNEEEMDKFETKYDLEKCVWKTVFFVESFWEDETLPKPTLQFPIPIPDDMYIKFKKVLAVRDPILRLDNEKRCIVEPAV